MVTETLRSRLREETRPAHDAVDALFARCDLCTYSGLRIFLASHRDALTAFLWACPDPDLIPRIDDALADLASDLRALEGCCPAILIAAPIQDDALAQAYLWHGSRLGTQVLARRFQSAWAGSPPDAGRYLNHAPDPAAWRDLSERLTALPARGVAADRTVAAAIAWFALFAAAARHHLTGATLDA